MARETWVQSQIKSYQRLKKWYLMLPCLTLSIIMYGSRVKWGNPGKGVAPSPTPWHSSYRKGSLWVSLDYGCQLYLSYQHFKSLLKRFFTREKKNLFLRNVGKRIEVPYLEFFLVVQPTSWLPSQLGLLNTPTASVQRGKTPLQRVSWTKPWFLDFAVFCI